MRLHWGVCVLVLGLVGCQNEPEQPSSQYLLLHPAELKNEMGRCQEMKKSGGGVDTYCAMVATTLQSFFDTLMQQQREPEQFGQRIIAAQEAYGWTLNNVVLAKQTLDSKTASNASPAEITASQSAYQTALDTAAAAKATVDALLVIVGQSSPE